MKYSHVSEPPQRTIRYRKRTKDPWNCIYVSRHSSNCYYSVPIPKLYEGCLEGSRRVVLLLLWKHPPIRDGKQPQVTVSDVQGLAIYQTLGAVGIILTRSKNCNTKPVYIENGQGMFCPYRGGGTNTKSSLVLSTRFLWTTMR